MSTSMHIRELHLDLHRTIEWNMDQQLWVIIIGVQCWQRHVQTLSPWPEDASHAACKCLIQGPNLQILDPSVPANSCVCMTMNFQAEHRCTSFHHLASPIPEGIGAHMGLVYVLMERPGRPTIGGLAVVIMSAAGSKVWHGTALCSLASLLLAKSACTCDERYHTSGVRMSRVVSRKCHTEYDISIRKVMCLWTCRRLQKRQVNFPDAFLHTAYLTSIRTLHFVKPINRLCHVFIRPLHHQASMDGRKQ